MIEEEVKKHVDMLTETKQETRLSNFKTLLKEYYHNIYIAIFKTKQQ